MTGLGPPVGSRGMEAREAGGGSLLLDKIPSLPLPGSGQDEEAPAAGDGGSGADTAGCCKFALIAWFTRSSMPASAPCRDDLIAACRLCTDEDMAV